MPPEIIVALIAGGCLFAGSLVTAVVGFATAGYQTRRIVQKADNEALAERDRLLWEQARKFWDEREQAYKAEIELEQTARKAGEAALTADIALLKQSEAKLRQAHIECEEKTTRLEARLFRAGLSLQSEEI